MKKLFAILIAAALLFAASGCAEKATDAPIDFSGKTFDEIVDWSVKNGLEEKFSYEFLYDDTVPAGQAAKQSVAAGGSLENGITVTVSLGKQPSQVEPGAVAIPNIIGKDVSDAVQECSYSGIDISEITYIKTKLPSGTVLKTDPMCGTTVTFGGSINVVCSEEIKGSKKVDVLADWSKLCFETQEVEVEAYLEDKKVNSQCKCVPVSAGYTTVHFEAEGGKKQARITLNGIAFNYEIDFDSGDYTETEQ